MTTLLTNRRFAQATTTLLFVACLGAWVAGGLATGRPRFDLALAVYAANFLQTQRCLNQSECGPMQTSGWAVAFLLTSMLFLRVEGGRY